MNSDGGEGEKEKDRAKTSVRRRGAHDGWASKTR